MTSRQSSLFRQWCSTVYK